MNAATYLKMWGLFLVLSICLAGCPAPEQAPEITGADESGQPAKFAESIGTEKATEGAGAIVTEDPSRVAKKTGPAAVVLETAKGDIVLELDRKAAPVTVANFLQYVEEGFYDGTIFHRVIPGFMIQGGGHTADMGSKPTRSPIANEASNGLKNLRGTIAMARTSVPNSATSQFFINHGDNPSLDYGSSRDPAGYAVFGKVVKGMDVVNNIALGETTWRNNEKSFPVKPVVVKRARVISE